MVSSRRLVFASLAEALALGLGLASEVFACRDSGFGGRVRGLELGDVGFESQGFGFEVHVSRSRPRVVVKALHVAFVNWSQALRFWVAGLFGNEDWIRKKNYSAAGGMDILRSEPPKP